MLFEKLVVVYFLCSVISKLIYILFGIIQEKNYMPSIPLLMQFSTSLMFGVLSHLDEPEFKTYIRVWFIFDIALVAVMLAFETKMHPGGIRRKLLFTFLLSVTFCLFIHFLCGWIDDRKKGQPIRLTAQLGVGIGILNKFLQHEMGLPKNGEERISALKNSGVMIDLVAVFFRLMGNFALLVFSYFTFQTCEECGGNPRRVSLIYFLLSTIILVDLYYIIHVFKFSRQSMDKYKVYGTKDD